MQGVSEMGTPLFYCWQQEYEPPQAILFTSLYNYALCVPDNRIQGKK